MDKIIFNKKIVIGDRTITTGSPTFIIAEAGVNHNGDIKLAKDLIDVAASSGVDAIKFQAFKTEELIKENVRKADYQNNSTEKNESQYEMLKRLEISQETIKELYDYCATKDLICIMTPFDEESLEIIDKINMPAIKVASTDLTNIGFIEKIAKTGKPVLLSTGMSYMSEVILAVKAVHRYNKNLILLQCSANYPIEDDEANLRVLQAYKDEFDIITGYSDHTRGIGASPYSIPLGALVIEKHFTLDKNMSGPDHSASLSPLELRDLVMEIRRVEKFLGVLEKLPTLSESKNRKSLQKYFVAKDKIQKGDVFSEENVCAKRTGGLGISPIYRDSLFGTVAKMDYEVNDII